MASRRCMTPTRLVMSSATPKMKAGMPANKMGVSMAWMSAGALPHATTSPKTMGMPPMRGVGAVWNFCTPSVKSMVSAPCQGLVSTRRTHCAKQEAKPQAAAVMAGDWKTLCRAFRMFILDQESELKLRHTGFGSAGFFA